MLDHAPNKMASGEATRCVYSGHNITVQSSNLKLTECRVDLYNTEIKLLENTDVRMTIPLAQVSNIEVHQPIFGANYITVETINRGSKCSFTITFNRGGATEFARAFFRITEGKLVSTETAQLHEPEPTPTESKKTV